MTRAILGKELRTLWCSPIPYVVGAIFQAVVSLLFVNQLELRRQALAQPLFPVAGFLLLAMVPVVTMRTVADEARTGTLDLLEALPVSARAVIVGKWLASWITVVVVLAPLLLIVPLLELFGNPDLGPVISGFSGLVALTGALAGIGVLASSLTSAQPVAAMVAFFASILLWFAHVGSQSMSVGGWLDALSISERLRQFAGGVVDSSDLVFFAVLTAVTLTAAVIVVDSRRFR